MTTDINSIKDKLIEHIEQLMMGHVRRAVYAHIKKYGVYEINCQGFDAKSSTMRCFMALDEEVAAAYEIEIIGVSYTYTTIELLIAPIERLQYKLPAHVGNGYWKIHIEHEDVVDGKVSYMSFDDMQGWQWMSCSTINQSLTLDQLEETKTILDSLVMEYALLQD